MSTTCRVALVQLRTPDTPRAALDHALPLIARAADTGAGLIITPETSNVMQRDPAALDRLVVAEDEDGLALTARRLCRERGVWLLLGSVVVRRPDGLRANRSLLIAPGGEIAARYDKIHLFDVDLPDGRRYRESDAYAPGERAVTAMTPWGGLGLAICYDIRFPELFRDLATAGADMIATPAAFTRATGSVHWEVLQRARAIETGAFVLAAGQGGDHADGSATWGRSMIVSPWGEVLAAAEGDEPGVVVADLDLAAVARARAAIPALRHRRAYAAAEPMA